ncbi:unnamed protein product [Orchesella dallaii]|uniref:Uncharacterized protein n=1 Tax=Orchesella dallaii TaxID=48710 RepID=A0ABP1RSQ4_9HEXA
MSTGNKDEKPKKNARKRTNGQANQAKLSTTPSSSTHPPEDVESKEEKESEQTQPLDLRTIQRVVSRSSSTSSGQRLPPPPLPPPTPIAPGRRPTPVLVEPKFCDWCKKLTTPGLCGNSKFCKDTCFELYRRCHYKRRSCCIICGRRGDWDVGQVGQSTDRLEDLPERACGTCLRSSTEEMDPNERRNMRLPPSTTSPVTTTAINLVTTTSGAGPSNTTSARTSSSAAVIPGERTDTIIYLAPQQNYQTMTPMHPVSSTHTGLRGILQQPSHYQHQMVRQSVNIIQDFPTPSVDNAAIDHAFPLRTPNQSNYHSPPALGGSFRTPNQSNFHSPPAALGGSIRMPTRNNFHSPPALRGSIIMPTPTNYHSPSAFGGSIRMPTPSNFYSPPALGGSIRMPTPSNYHSPPALGSSVRMPTPSNYHSPPAPDGSMGMPTRIRIAHHSPPALDGSMRMPTRIRIAHHSPPALDGSMRMPTRIQITHHSPQALSGAPTPESRHVVHPQDVSTPESIILDMTPTSHYDQQPNNSWFPCEQLYMHTVSRDASPMPSPRPSCSTPGSSESSHVFAPIRPDRPPVPERPRLVPRRRCSSTTVSDTSSPQGRSPRTPQGIPVPSPIQEGYQPYLLAAAAAMDERNIVSQAQQPPTTPLSDYSHQLSVDIPDNSDLQSLAERGYAPTMHYISEGRWQNRDANPGNSPHFISNGMICNGDSSVNSNETSQSSPDYLMQNIPHNQIITHLLRSSPRLPPPQLGSTHGFDSITGHAHALANNQQGNSSISNTMAPSRPTNNFSLSNVSSSRDPTSFQYQPTPSERIKRGSTRGRRTNGWIRDGIVPGYKQLVENLFTPATNNPITASVDQEQTTAPNNGVVDGDAGSSEIEISDIKAVAMGTHIAVATNTSPPPSSPPPPPPPSPNPTTVSVATNTEENPTGTIMFATPGRSSITERLSVPDSVVVGAIAALSAVVAAATSRAASATPGTSSRLSNSFEGAAPVAKLPLLFEINNKKPQRTAEDKKAKKAKDNSGIPKNGEKKGSKEEENSTQESTTQGQTPSGMGDQENETNGASTDVPTEAEDVINRVDDVNENGYVHAAKITRKDDGAKSKEDNDQQ